MIEQIIETKKREVAALLGVKPGSRTKTVRPLLLKDGVNIIAELKRKSPSAGDLGEIDDERIAVYSRYATAMSILTDRTYFNGSFDILAETAQKTDLPILCKDFFIDECQIDLAYAKGADLILLIVRILDDRRLLQLYEYARSLGLECLVEIHTLDELARIKSMGAAIVGVNGRDLDTLTIDLNRSHEIISQVDAPVRIAESGIRTRQDIARFREANCFLIGETLMRAGDAASLSATFEGLLHD